MAWPHVAIALAGVLAGGGAILAQSTRPATAPAAAPAEPNDPRPTKAIPLAGCVTARCHAAVKGQKVLHGPVNVNACDACHQLTSAEKHTFRLARDKTAVCTFCHQTKITGPVVHKPVQTGDCLPCHDPHGAPNKSFLRGRTMNDTCKKCHKDVMAGKTVAHGPVAAGACGACHEAHVSQFPKLLVGQGRDLCLSCHAEMKKQMAAARYTHKAVEADCLSCHEAHASNFPMQTRQAPVQLCTEKCHEPVKAAALGAPFKHTVVTEGQGCLHCHTAHGGQLAKLMRTRPVDACMKCHDKKIDTPGGREVPAVGEVVNPALNKHGPVQQGNCGGCHEVHGGTVSRLLAGPYPEGFYEPFSTDSYALCFKCHNQQLALMKDTTTVTGFRDGKRNLHYVHINKGRQGRSCRACHSTHASSNPVHVRESVPYGKWQMPVSFQATPTGGTCASGCHRQLSYDRDKPVQAEEEPQPATQPAAQPAGKEPKEKP